MVHAAYNIHHTSYNITTTTLVGFRTAEISRKFVANLDANSVYTVPGTVVDRNVMFSCPIRFTCRKTDHLLVVAAQTPRYNSQAEFFSVDAKWINLPA